MVYDAAQRLVDELKQSDEYMQFAAAKEAAMQNDTTRALIADLHKLQMQAQAASLAGKRDDEALNRLQRIGEMLQFNPEAAEYLTAEFRLNRMMGDIYKMLAKAMEIDLSLLEG